MSRRRRCLAGLAAGLLLALPRNASADPASAHAVAEQLHFTILRDGDPIGTDEVDLFRQGNRVTIVSRAEVAVTIASITVFRLSSWCEEEWVDGRLGSYLAHTDYNGHLHEVSARPDGDGLAVTENGVLKRFAEVSLVGTLWNAETVRQSRLVDPINGKLRKVSVADLGVESVEVGGLPVQAHRYSMSGGLRREIWYGPDGRILRLEFHAGDGSLIRVALP
jgi:hypothetical protein